MGASATVIIPTFGNAKFARWAIRSVQQQSVANIEICIICDGSPPEMVALFKQMEKEDPRLKVFLYPKSPRTGEPYRDIVIKHTTGNIICYCSHDDLWLPNHIREIEKSLRKGYFTHSIHAVVNLPTAITDEKRLFNPIYWIDLQDPKIIKAMLGGQNFFGLTYGAHTRRSYNELAEGWVTTPDKNIPTDLYMWCKFLSAYGSRCNTTRKITALCFPRVTRKNWSEQERDDELKLYFEKIQTLAFLDKIEEKSCRSLYQKTRYFVNKIYKQCVL